MSDTVSILDGNTFAVSDRRGDMALEHGSDSGLFRADTRFLSRWVLTIDGKHPNVLSIDDVQYFRTQFFMTLSTGTIYVNSHVSVIRRRAIGEGFCEELEIINHGTEPADMKVLIEADSDFADLFEVKDQLPKKGERYREIDRDRLVLGYRRDRFVRETWISSTEPARLTDKGLAYDLHLPAHGS
jgi:glycogen debranching enzyme